ncbi:MAG: hypothetical protein ACI865_002790 [Flavobacteriaceae bacterium]|jgi:uncharacterized protein (DUF1501 family)
MKRRDFVRNLALVSAGTPILLKEMQFQSVGKPWFGVAKSAEDRVLVIIRMNGGNDGLSTVIPRDQYANLTIQRSNVLVPELSVLPLTTEVGLHPKMTSMETMYTNGKLGIVQNVGYPEQNRSHFRSMDIWSSGLIDAQADTGWLGRHLDDTNPGYPTNYPSAACPDPFAISMGYDVSSTCQGVMANFSQALENPFDVYNLATSGSINDGTYYGDHMEYITTLINQANAYGTQINDAANAGGATTIPYDLSNPLAQQLSYVAQMIDGGLQTNVYILNVNGFDTHDSQVDTASTEEGNHAELLKRISDAVGWFQDDLAARSLEQRVTGMTFSEFGRQVASNASLGTDHGDAAPLLLFGACLTTSIMGANPLIDNAITNQQGIPMQIDFRDVYASILKDWFGVGTTEIQSFFEHTVTYYSLVGGCELAINEVELVENQALIYPNPAIQNTQLRFTAKNEWVKVDIYDINQRHVASVYDGNLSEGEHNMAMEVSTLAPGQYMVSILKESGTIHTKLVKVN